MSTPTSKRRRVEVSTSAKRDICQYKEDHPKATIADIRQHVMKSMCLDIGKSTVGDILKAKEKWLNISDDSPDLLRYRKPKHQELEDAVFLWFTDMSSHHAAINDEMLITKAKTLGDQLDIKDFSYSRGWLQRFKTRRGIKRKLYHGEADSVDKTVVEEGRTSLQRVFADYDPEDVYNIDETGLFFRLGPNHTLATTSVRGVKASKDRITIALAANGTGNHKLKPFVITKVQRPRCFGKTYNPQTYVHYRHNKKAWMTAELFIDWLKVFDRQMRLAGRNVILLVDNAASHSQGDLQLTNVRLHHLPPNTTAHIQPMDAGIIKAFKAHYRKLLVKHYIDCAEDDRDQTVNLREALHMVKTAWDSVTCRTIANCYRHVNILAAPDQQPSQTSPQTEQDNDDDDIPLLELQRLMRKLPTDSTQMTADDYVQIDRQEETGQNLSDTDILEIVRKTDEEEKSENETSDSDPFQPDVTLKEAQSSLQTLISFFEQTTAGETAEDTLTTLWKLSQQLKEKGARESKQKKLTDFFSS